MFHLSCNLGLHKNIDLKYTWHVDKYYSLLSVVCFMCIKILCNIPPKHNFLKKQLSGMFLNCFFILALLVHLSKRKPSSFSLNQITNLRFVILVLRTIPYRSTHKSLETVISYTEHHTILPFLCPRDACCIVDVE